jgi:Cu+-exporting ATPase
MHPEIRQKGPGHCPTVNQTGALLVEARRVGGDTLLANIVRRVGEAQRSRAPIQTLADRVSGVFVPVVVAIAVVTFAVWALVGPEPRLAWALVNAIAVLIIACPCALGLATPISIVVGAGRGATAGVLVRDAEALELMEKVDTVVVDKTGTLTLGRPELATFEADDPDLLRLAASLEGSSEHPLAAAIVKGAEQRGHVLVEPTAFRSITGKGVVGTVDGRELALGNRALLDDLGVSASDLEVRADALRADGQTVLFAVVGGRTAGLFGVADPIRDSTPEAMQQLRDDGIRVVMLTGDHRRTAEAVARALGIVEIHAEVLPDRKSEVIARLLAEGRCRDRDGHGDRHCDGVRGRHARQGRSARHLPRANTLPRRLAQRSPDPRLRVRLQHRRRAACRRRPVPGVRAAPVSDDCERGDEPLLGVRHRQRATAPPGGALIG